MPSVQKTLELLLTGRSDANIRFAALRSLLRSMNFDERVKGDHFIYTRPDVEEIINIQPAHAGKAKVYQVRQVRSLITKYGLTIGG
jgi:hypothetical protein